MYNEQELERLQKIEKRIREIAEEEGLLTTDIDFEIVPAQRMLEGMAYNFPTNFHHWSFGRDYEKNRTIYDHSGAGIPYEQVWNFDVPRALLVETNPFALNVVVLAHVYGHVDFFLGSNYLKYGRSFANIAEEARNSAERFREYEVIHGKDEVEKTIDAGMSIQWQQNPDPFADENMDDEEVRNFLLEREREKLRGYKDIRSEFKKPDTKEEREQIEQNLKYLSRKTPPLPVYDLLGYITRHSMVLEPWQKDILSVLRHQARSLTPGARTKMLDEGWATYWHVHILRRLCEEGLLTPEEHGIFNFFHARVTRESPLDFNWYNIGFALFEYIKERWDKGQFGKEYEHCEDPNKKAYWDTKVMKGREKIFEVRTNYSDRMAVEIFFTDDFIRRMRLYIYEEEDDKLLGGKVLKIVEDDPKVIRTLLKQAFTLHGMMPIAVHDANYHNQGELYLKHDFTGMQLDPIYRNGTLENIYKLWGRVVYLETVENGKRALFSYDGIKHKIKA